MYGCVMSVSYMPKEVVLDIFKCYTGQDIDNFYVVCGVCGSAGIGFY